MYRKGRLIITTSILSVLVLASWTALLIVLEVSVWIAA